MNHDKDKDKEGWVYCISNENVRSAKLPNILLKIGMTERTPHERLAEANRSDTWRPPLNYKIEFAKKVKNALQKEKTIHKLLEQYNERVNSSREFFDISVEKARLYFDLMDGEYLELKDAEGLKPEPKPKPEPKKTKVQRGGQKNKEDKNNIIVSDEPETKLKQSFSQQITPSDIIIENLSKTESKRLIKVALEKHAIEIKVNDKYHHYDDLLVGSLQGQLYSDMIFSAIIKSVDDADRIINSSDLLTIIEKIKVTAPSTFLYLEEKEEKHNDIIIPEPEVQISPNQLGLILNINIKDLSAEESKTLLQTAINQEALHIKIGKRYNRFYELDKIKPNKLKNTIFEAHIVEAPDGISSIDEDCAFFISKLNYKSILKTLKNTSKTQYIILSELCKM
jgi:hypothetical protein